MLDPTLALPTLALLTRTPATLDALLRTLPDARTRANEGPNTWNACDVLGHLIFGERTDWMPRIHIILDHGESRPFDPFDRWGHVREIEGKSLPHLLDEFAAIRAQKLDELRALHLTPADLEKRGRHPSLGVVTLSQLLAAWTVHDLTHLHQIARILAHQDRAAVGPWAQYLGVLQCNGHG
ncbi:MAG TPA: DinB family protein [Acidobacteriaceae bacterium]|jgi:hypothetical protein|nr:DinB family protein [Acidobacteriaceae bacterium]